jgi:NAD(P)-dependent dehydrogenase (short-subunit alcohol dehydrogenase family)
MTKNSRNKIALVTGANRGIGFEVCRQLAQKGMTVLLTTRDSKKAEATTKTLAEEGFDVRPKTLDVSDAESVRRLATELEQEFGSLDVLVSNAAAYVDWSEMASTADLKTAQNILETNLLGAWRTSQMFLPLLRRSPHGRLVNISSGAGSHGDSQFGLTPNRGSVASYGISRAALNASP